MQCVWRLERWLSRLKPGDLSLMPGTSVACIYSPSDPLGNGRHQKENILEACWATDLVYATAKNRQINHPPKPSINKKELVSWTRLSHELCEVALWAINPYSLCENWCVYECTLGCYGVCVLARVQYLGGRLSSSTVGSWDPTQAVGSVQQASHQLKPKEPWVKSSHLWSLESEDYKSKEVSKAPLLALSLTTVVCFSVGGGYYDNSWHWGHISAHVYVIVLRVHVSQVHALHGRSGMHRHVSFTHVLYATICVACSSLIFAYFS